MGTEATSCPVCRKQGFLIEELKKGPKRCPQCGWLVEVLITDPSDANKRKLEKWRVDWQADGQAQVLAKRLAELFEGISTSWQAGCWTETLGLYDQALQLDPDNVRVGRERPLALFCLMESLLERFAKARLEELKRKSRQKKTSLEKRLAEAELCEKVGMVREAVKASEDAGVLKQMIDEDTSNAQALKELLTDLCESQRRNGRTGGVLLHRDRSLGELLVCGNPYWVDAGFRRIAWEPFVAEIDKLIYDEQKYAAEFRNWYEMEFERIREEHHKVIGRREQAKLEKEGFEERPNGQEEELFVDVYIVSESTLDEQKFLDRTIPSKIKFLSNLDNKEWLVKPADKNISDRGIALLIRDLADARIRRFSLEECKNLTDLGLAHLKNLTWLELLDFPGTGITDTGLAHLKNFTSLTHLNLRWTRVTDLGLAHCNNMTSLTNFDLGHTKITDAGLTHLKNLTSLTHLNLYGTEIANAGLAVFENLTALTNLDLGHTKITDVGLAHLKNLASLTQLNLHGTEIADAGLEHLKNLTSLEWLDLRGTKITDTGLDYLKNFTSLTHLDLFCYKRVTAAGVRKFLAARPEVRIRR